MNGIEINYNRTVTVKRFSTAANGTGEYTTHLANVACHIQPLEEGLSEDLDGNFGKDFLMFCDVLDILEGDRVVDGSVEYNVTAVDSFTFLQIARHMEVKIRLSNA